jgi:prevent-host-death family protein
MAEQTLASSDFKARCLQILDEVERTGTSVLVTKRGRPVARLVPLAGAEAPSLLGSVRFPAGDSLLDPTGEHWQAEGSE